MCIDYVWRYVHINCTALWHHAHTHRLYIIYYKCHPNPPIPPQAHTCYCIVDTFRITVSHLSCIYTEIILSFTGCKNWLVFFVFYRKRILFGNYFTVWPCDVCNQFIILQWSLVNKANYLVKGTYAILNKTLSIRSKTFLNFFSRPHHFNYKDKKKTHLQVSSSL